LVRRVNIDPHIDEAVKHLVRLAKHLDADRARRIETTRDALDELVDAILCAWTGLLWMVHGQDRCQVLGSGDEGDTAGTFIAPARPEQRRND
jgi:predicted RNase H-like nuclease